MDGFYLTGFCSDTLTVDYMTKEGYLMNTELTFFSGSVLIQLFAASERWTECQRNADP